MYWLEYTHYPLDNDLPLDSIICSLNNQGQIVKQEPENYIFLSKIGSENGKQSHVPANPGPFTQLIIFVSMHTQHILVKKSK